MTFEEWFHKEYEPADLQLKQYAERKEGLHIPAELYLEEIQKAYEAGQKDSKAQIEKMKCCENCIETCNSDDIARFCKDNKYKLWEVKEK